jgi:hypothetical protein
VPTDRFTEPEGVIHRRAKGLDRLICPADGRAAPRSASGRACQPAQRRARSLAVVAPRDETTADASAERGGIGIDTESGFDRARPVHEQFQRPVGPKWLNGGVAGGRNPEGKPRLTRYGSIRSDSRLVVKMRSLGHPRVRVSANSARAAGPGRPKDG